MRGWLAAAVAIVAAVSILGGCSSEKRKPLGGEEAVARARSLADQVCACKDAGCFDGLDQQWNQVSSLLHGVKLTPAEIDALALEQQRYWKCVGTTAK